MQNRENSARMMSTTSFGFPSQTRTLDSWSYFFITDSRSMGSSCLGFFFNNDIFYLLSTRIGNWLQRISTAANVLLTFRGYWVSTVTPFSA